MTPLFLDIETFYEPDGEYSLSKMSTMQYVRDARFECLGVALHTHRSHWKPGSVMPKAALWAMATVLVEVDWTGATTSSIWVPGPDTGKDIGIAHALNAIDWSHTVAIAHNAAFDAAILQHHYHHRPALWIDTLAWVRWAISQGAAPADARTSLKWWGGFLGLDKGDTAAAVGAGGDELKAYALRDIEILQRLAAWLTQHAPWPELELRFADVHVRMAAEPVLELDTELLEREAAQAADPDLVKAVRSRDTFARLLRAHSVEPGMKTSPATGKATYAFAKTDAFMQGLAEHHNPVVQELHRLKTEAASTIKQTRAQRFLDVGSPMPMPQTYYGAHTGRTTGSEKLNVLNLPRGAFRAALKAPAGCKLLVADYAQIEARVIAWGAGDDYSLSIFRSGRDPYKEVASRELYGVPYDQVTGEQRRRAKAAVLALGFGQGVNGFGEYCRMFGIEMDAREAGRIVKTYRHNRPRLVAFWRTLHAWILNYGDVMLPSGRLLTYPGMARQGREVSYLRHSIFSRSKDRDRVNLWHGLVAENWTQAVARDILMHAVNNLPSYVTPVLLPYDEIVVVGQPEHALALHAAMLKRPAWAEGLPLMVDDPVVCDNYGEVR